VPTSLLLKHRWNADDLVFQERVEGLKLETKRLKARLAANTGQADLLSFILQNDSESLSFVDDLRTKLKLVRDVSLPSRIADVTALTALSGPRRLRRLQCKRLLDP
jgi:hypothetical protein